MSYRPRPLCPAFGPDRRKCVLRDVLPRGGKGWLHRRWRWSLPVTFVTDVNQKKRKKEERMNGITPILSTSILSRPSGPRELFMMFAIDWAASTFVGMLIGINIVIESL